MASAKIKAKKTSTAKRSTGEAPTIAFRDAQQFEHWLDEHAHDPAGVWLKVAKKSSGIPTMSDDEAVDVGLCYGWISGQRRALDGQYYLQKYVPRRPRSLWSQVNVAKVESLIAAGRMRAAGLAEVDVAKTDGRWAAAYASQREAQVPDDLAAALKANRVAARSFAALGRTQQYGLMLKLLTARSATARATQLQRVLGELAPGDPPRTRATKRRAHEPAPCIGSDGETSAGRRRNKRR